MRWSDLVWLLAGVALNAAAQLGLKSATQATGRIEADAASLWNSAQQIALVPALWLALLAYGASVIVWIVGLSRVPVSQAYPVLSLGYVVTALAAWAWLGEAVTWQRLLGIGVIIAGVWLVARS
jgi:multidrug transporter EmrE-like cation transporter